MLLLVDPGLEHAAIVQLVEYQADVDNAGDYATQVQTGKRSFLQHSSNATFRTVRRALATMCAGAQRCGYCEDSVGDQVEHMQPKDLYPNAVFVWENYIFACGPCNRGKNNKFSIVSSDGQIVDVTRQRNTPIIPPPSGRPALVNPRIANPLDFFDLEIEETFAFLPREGLDQLNYSIADNTIKILKLNRDVLLEARTTAFGSYRARLVEFIERRDSGAAPERLDQLIRGLRTMPHPTVWSEIKRQHVAIEELTDLFRRAPEALNW